MKFLLRCFSSVYFYNILFSSLWIRLLPLPANFLNILLKKAFSIMLSIYSLLYFLILSWEPYDSELKVATNSFWILPLRDGV